MQTSLKLQMFANLKARAKANPRENFISVLKITFNFFRASAHETTSPYSL